MIAALGAPTQPQEFDSTDAPLFTARVIALADAASVPPLWIGMILTPGAVPETPIPLFRMAPTLPAQAVP